MEREMSFPFEFTYLVDWAVKFYGDTLGYLPAFVQYELLCDLQWRFREIYDMSEVLTPEEKPEYLKSEYYEMYGQLLSSKELFDTAESLGYSILNIQNLEFIWLKS